MVVVSSYWKLGDAGAYSMIPSRISCHVMSKVQRSSSRNKLLKYSAASMVLVVMVEKVPLVCADTYPYAKRRSSDWLNGS